MLWNVPLYIEPLSGHCLEHLNLKPYLKTKISKSLLEKSLQFLLIFLTLSMNQFLVQISVFFVMETWVTCLKLWNFLEHLLLNLRQSLCQLLNIHNDYCSFFKLLYFPRYIFKKNINTKQTEKNPFGPFLHTLLQLFSM